MSKIVRKRLGELFSEYINGYAFESNRFEVSRKEGLLPILKIANIGSLGKTDFHNCHFMKKDGYEKFVSDIGDLAFSLTGSLGYVAVVSERCLVNQRVLVIRRKPEYSELLDIIQPFIQSKDFTDYCFSKATNENNKNISHNVILDYEIPIFVKADGTYDLEEQQRLAGIYSEIEDQKQKLLRRAYDIQELLIHIDKEEGIEYADEPLLKLFTLKNGNSSFTKAYTNAHKGPYALYSANTDGPYEFIDSYDYDGDYLTWAKDGLAGYIMVHNGEKFSITGHRSIFILNDGVKDLSLCYVKYFLEPVFRNLKKGRMGKMGANEYTTLNPEMIKAAQISIPIPLTADGSYDLEKQREIADRYKQIDEIKQGLIDKIIQLTSISVIPETTEA